MVPGKRKRAKKREQCFRCLRTNSNCAVRQHCLNLQPGLLHSRPHSSLYGSLHGWLRSTPHN